MMKKCEASVGPTCCIKDQIIFNWKFFAGVGGSGQKMISEPLGEGVKNSNLLSDILFDSMQDHSNPPTVLTHIS